MSKTYLESYGATDTGKIRKINQDAFLNLPEHQFWLVADGMGGHSSGEYASAAIINALNTFTPKKAIGATVSDIRCKLSKVNKDLYDLANEGEKHGIIGSTVAALFIHKRYSVSLWSGDSRIYLFRKGKLVQITNDHNYEAFLLANGAKDEEVINHPFAQSLTHAVGSDEMFFLEEKIQEIRQKDIFLICSDGLNKEVSDQEIEAILQTTRIQESIELLMNLCLDRRARDNVTIVLVQFDEN